MTTGCFVTGTDTGIGKTWVSMGLARGWHRAGYATAALKPIASGCETTPEGLRNEDALLLQASASVALPYDTVNPYRFEPPIAPHIAAREAGVTIAFDRVRRAVDEARAAGAERVVVEGVGGWQVPLAGQATVADLAAFLELPVVLVVGLRLGCLNHALLTLESIHRRGVGVLGWVANAVDPDFDRAEANLATLKERLDAPLLGVVPWLAHPDADRIAQALDLT